MRFDTHLHVWSRGDGGGVRIRARLPELDHDFGFEAVRPMLAAAGVDKVVLVSAAQEEAETQRLLALAEAHPAVVAGVIGWVDLEAPDAGVRIAAYAAQPKWLGARLPLTILDDRSWIARPAVVAALRALGNAGGIAEILAAPDQFAAVAAAIGQLPDLRIIIDHAGNPDFGRPPEPAWRDGLAELARHPRAICKVSAFWAPGDPPVDDDVALMFFSHVVETFGCDRMIAAANWPVSSLAGAYDASWHRLDRLAARHGLAEGQRHDLMSGTARRLCGL